MYMVNTFERHLLRPMHMVKCYLSADAKPEESPIVTVKQGKLKGSVKSLIDGTPYYSFKGIPYAQPPVGDLRFRAPLPPKSWDGVRDALKHGAPCPQFHLFHTAQLIRGNEDCLFLNIYTKSLKKKSPVLVFIHGGSYMYGSGNSEQYGPEFLLQHDVVLVTLNYRLEALGFLCLEIEEAPGNAGIKDQVFALRWIKDNIAAFGGDIENITVFGQSAGASSATLHTLSPMSKGLFHKAIALCGTFINEWATGRDARNRAFRLGKFLGKDTTDPKELVNFLRTVPAAALTGVTHKTLTEEEKHRGLSIHFAPVVETKFKDTEAFLTERPLDLLMKGNVSKIPVLTGYNSGEGIVIVIDHMKKRKIYNKYPAYLIPREIAEKVSPEKVKHLGKLVKHFYVGDSSFSKRTIPSISNFNTDLHFAYPIYRFAELYHKIAPVYVYKFDYDTDLNLVKAFSGLTNLPGAAHSDELHYLFYSDVADDIYTEQEEIKRIVYKLTKFWTDFAKTGNPTPDKGVKWLPYTSSDKHYMLLNNNISLQKDDSKERIAFWDKLYADSELPCISKK